MLNGRPFRVVWGSRARVAIKDLQREVKETGYSQVLARALRRLLTRLQFDPADLGEIYRLEGSIEQ